MSAQARSPESGAIELVVFDLAGTTVEDPDVVGTSLRAALDAVGVVAPEDQINAMMGLPKPEAIRVLLESSGLKVDDLDAVVAAVHRDFVGRMVRVYSVDPSIVEVPGTSRTFEILRASGIKVAVDTGFSRDITLVLLDRLGWAERGLIDASITSDEVARGRPHPDMIERLMARLGITDPARVAKVGDTTADLEEGHNAGCGMIVGVANGSHGREQLAGSPHTHLIASVAELPRVLGLE